MILRASVASLFVLLSSACAGVRGTREGSEPLALATMETLRGDPVALGGPGRVRLVEVWATWCNPCRAASNTMGSVLARHPEVAGYALSVDEDLDVLRRYVERHRVAGTPLHLRGGAAAARREGLVLIPRVIALDARGRFAGSVTGAGPGLEPAVERLIRTAAVAPSDRM